MTLGMVVLVALAGVVARVMVTPNGPAGSTTAPTKATPSSVAKPSPPALAGPVVVDPAWVAATAARVGIPVPAMRAYATAQLRAPHGCRLDWTTLAGVGWVESQHATIGGRTLADDGHPSSPILGPALDGTRFGAVPATARSRELTGDSRWDHASGPMQFVTSTWSRWGRDGDGDGLADPEDIDDAAATAAAYMCASGLDLTTGSGWAGAIWSYNHSAQYTADVYAAAQTYADRSR